MAEIDDDYNGARPQITRASPEPSPAELKKLELERQIQHDKAQRTKWRAIGLVGAVLLAGWFFRWDVHMAQESFRGIAVNRITGEFRAIFSEEYVVVKEQKP